MFGAFGASTSTNPGGFGALFPSSSRSDIVEYFKGGGAFGNNANAGTSAFGAPKPATGFGAFGGSGGTGAFGSGAFGSNTNTSGGGLFGQANTNNAAGAFGSGSGLFGNKPAGASAFGSPGSYTYSCPTPTL